MLSVICFTYHHHHHPFLIPSLLTSKMEQNFKCFYNISYKLEIGRMEREGLGIHR